MAEKKKVHSVFGMSKDDGCSDTPFSTVNNYLGLNLYKKLSEEEGNIFFSPVSISLAFSMLYAGCRGVSAAEMRNVLGYNEEDINDDTLFNHISEFLKFHESASQKYTLAIANALFSQKEFPFFSEFMSIMQNTFHSSGREVDFRNESDKIMCEINEWVKEKTKNMIPNLLSSLDPSTVLILVNAVYFKGNWVHQFIKASTKPRVFYNYGLESKAKEVPMMYVKEKFLYTANEEYQALSLPYEGDDVSMLIILPRQKDGLKSLEQKILSKEITISKADFWKVSVRVTLPKLHLEYSKQLIEVFQNLGLKSVFFPKEADLSGLSGCPNICVSEVIHKAVLDVNEEGTEAAAATAIGVMLCCLELDYDFVAEHPFLFFIKQDRTDVIYFMGRIEEL